MEIGTLRQLILDNFKKALNDFYKIDTNILGRNLHERTLANRMSIYLDKYFHEDDIYVDVEYNRNGLDTKLAQLDRNCGPKKILPDIIVHKRIDGAIYDDERTNLLVIEMKKMNNSSVKRDDQKLKALTSDIGTKYKDKYYVYHYVIGIFFRPSNELEKAEIIIYTDGSINSDLTKEYTSDNVFNKFMNRLQN